MADFKTSNELVSYLKGMGYTFISNENTETLAVNSVNFIFNTITNKYSIGNLNAQNGIQAGRETSLDLTKPENHSVVMLLIKLLRKGYAPNSITLEKQWQTGHAPVFLDLMLRNSTNEDVFMFEVKKLSEFYEYAKPEKKSKVNQVLSYAMQEQNTRIASFYSYDFDNGKDCFANIYCADLRSKATNVDDLYDLWNKQFDTNDYINANSVFSIKKSIKKYENLNEIKPDNTKVLFNQFLTILRLNSISDKPTAFMKLINLFLTKLADEITENKEFDAVDEQGQTLHLYGLKFQYVDNETPESFMKRLNELYKDGMKRYMNKDVIDYTDADIDKLLGGNSNSGIMEMFDNLRLKKDINFAFIEVYDESTFLENYEVVKAIVQLLENYKLKYETKQQFLGDFFEELLNTSLKQEAGQFFTPYPIVDFMVNSLDVEEKIKHNLKNGDVNFVPTVIDYACGAGHFLISMMAKIQSVLNEINTETLTNTQKKDIESYKNNPFSWANDKTIVGVEKDYRLAKTTKIASFLNGDGNAEIIAGDGINKFDCAEYQQTILRSSSSNNEIFDYVVSNPPYSVDGFMLNLRRNGINKTSGTFSLLTGDINEKDSAIEIFFVERMQQLLKNGGVGAIILPQSVLSGDKYEQMRKFIFDNFKILSLLLTADITFSGTTTSPVIMFLRKEKEREQNYNVLIHQSPKYQSPNISGQKDKEIKFLGYEFSSNRAKAGIKIKGQSVLSELINITHSFICSGQASIPANISQYSKIVRLSDVILNKTADYCGDIYPKRLICNGVPLSRYCSINDWRDNDFASNELKGYLEISNLGDQIPKKTMKTKRYCKAGDILVSSLTPRKEQIVIANGSFMLTPAIHVLSSFASETERDDVYGKLRQDSSIRQMNALLDGFKITYANINEQNLYNNILI